MIVKYLPLGIKINPRLTLSSIGQGQQPLCPPPLHGLGIRKGDRVAIMLPTSCSEVIAFYAEFSKARCSSSTNPPTRHAAELQHCFGGLGARAIVMLSRVYSRLAEIREQIAIEHVIIADLARNPGVALPAW